jgi:hypothetical protein
MRRYLVVANQTLQRAEQADELRKRIEAGPSSFYLLVPDTRAANYPDVAAAAGVAAQHDMVDDGLPAPRHR